MASYSKQVASGGNANGRGIKVAATGTPGTLLHTVAASSTDEIWLYARNSDSAARTLVVEFGGVTAPDDQITIELPANSELHCVIEGIPLGASLVVRAYCATANVIVCFLYANRIAP